MLIDIYHEHIEEASFLYDQRCNLFSAPDGDFEYQAEIEKHLEAHIDGLTIGADYSKPILLEYIESGDESGFFFQLFICL